jgi:putative Mn2+ efflux pump MntP
MDLFSIIAVAIGLGMDCFAVCVAAGIAVKCGRVPFIIRIALLFGFFQTAMAVLGWAGGSVLLSWIEPYDHWVASALLFFIGLKMIEEGLSDESGKVMNFHSLSVLLILAVATSIDALAVGLSLAVLQDPIFIPALVIGIGACLMSFAGFWIGDRFGSIIGSRAEIIGGGVLIIIGARILIEHLIL